MLNSHYSMPIDARTCKQLNKLNKTNRGIEPMAPDPYLPHKAERSEAFRY